MSSVQIRMDGNGTTSVNEWMSGARSPEPLGGGGDERNGEGNEQTDRQQYNGQWGNDNTIREEDRKGEMEGEGDAADGKLPSEDRGGRRMR